MVPCANDLSIPGTQQQHRLSSLSPDQGKAEWSGVERVGSGAQKSVNRLFMEREPVPSTGAMSPSELPLNPQSWLPFLDFKFFKGLLDLFLYLL